MIGAALFVVAVAVLLSAIKRRPAHPRSIYRYRKGRQDL